MTSKLIAAITIGAFCSPTLAQSAFQGFYGQVATGYEANNASGLNGTAVTAPGGVDNTGNLAASNQSFGSAPLVLGFGYNFSLNPQWLLGVGVDYSALSQTSSNYSYTNQGVDIPAGALLNGV